VSEGTNRNLPARNTLVQLLAMYTDPESYNAQYQRQTDGRNDYANSTMHTTVGLSKSGPFLEDCKNSDMSLRMRSSRLKKLLWHQKVGPVFQAILDKKLRSSAPQRNSASAAHVMYDRLKSKVFQQR